MTPAEARELTERYMKACGMEDLSDLGWISQSATQPEDLCDEDALLLWQSIEDEDPNARETAKEAL